MTGVPRRSRLGGSATYDEVFSPASLESQMVPEIERLNSAWNDGEWQVVLEQCSAMADPEPNADTRRT